MTALLLGLMVVAQANVPWDALRAQLAEARTAYDAASAQDVFDKLKAAPVGSDPAELKFRIDAALLAAELHRIAWERLSESDIAHRRPLGDKIDEAAEAALALLDQLPKDSEYYRIRADLLGVMIRSDFRAKKYRKDMETSAAKAVELDPKNAKGYVSQAKPFVFAKSNEGGDPGKAVELLNKALELDPALETARCLRGLAYKEEDKADLARADWQGALEKNPKCAPAADELKKLDKK